MVPHQFENQTDKQQEEQESAFDSLEANKTRLTSPLPPDSPDGTSQAAANNSSQVRQLSSMQQMANQSPAVIMQRQRQKSINASLPGQNSKGGRRSFAPPSIELIASSAPSSTASTVQRKPKPGQKVMQLISVMIEPRMLASPPHSVPENPPTSAVNDGAATESMDLDPSPQTRMVIDVIRVKGRPMNAYGDTPGDHSTAFGAHLDGFENALQGANLDNAYEYCKDEFQEISGLGMNDEIINNRKDEYRGYERSIPINQATIEALLAEEINSDMDQQIALLLQGMIGNLLSMRDLTKLNSFNTKAAIDGKTGSGKGEAHRLGFMRFQESNLKGKDKFNSPEEKEQAINAILDLFDAGAIRISIAQPRLFWPKFLGGVSRDISILDLIDQLWERHSRSISRAYPSVWHLLDEEEIRNYFHHYLRHNIQIGTYNEMFELKRSRNALQRELDKLNMPTMDTGESQRVQENDRRRDEETKLVVISEIEENDRLLNDLEQTRIELGFPPDQAFRNGKKIKHDSLQSHFDDDNIRLNHNGKIDAPALLWKNPSGKDDTDHDKYAEGSKRLASAGEAVQLTLNENEEIASVQFGSRPKSPWPGTMGAHTTAWTVHERILKAKILTQPIAQAKDAVDALLMEAENLMNQRRDLFQNEYDLPKIDTMNSSRTAAIALKDDQASFQAYPVLQLQKYISAYFQFLNNIWGMSANAVGTDGNGEGAACNNIKKLLAGRGPDLDAFLSVHEHELLFYVYKTLDLVKYQAATGKEDQMNKLTEDHWEFILQIYPDLEGLKGKPKPSPFTKPTKRNNWLRREAPPATGRKGPNKKKRNINDIGTPPPYPVRDSPEAAPMPPNIVSVSAGENSDLPPLTFDLSALTFPPGFSLNPGRTNDDSTLPPSGKNWPSSTPPQKHKKRRMTEPTISIPKLNPSSSSATSMDLDPSPSYAPARFTYSHHSGGGGVGMGYNHSAGGMSYPNKAPMAFVPTIPKFTILTTPSAVPGCTLIRWNFPPSGVYNVRNTDSAILDNAGRQFGWFNTEIGFMPS